MVRVLVPLVIFFPSHDQYSNVCSLQTNISFNLISRRRKTKCDGVRPRCRHCASRHRQCVWPDDSADGSPHIATPLSPVPSTVVTAMTSSPSTVPSALPEWPAVKRCLDLFIQYHWATDFCSFLHRPDFEAHYSETPFLAVSIVALCSRYLTQEEAHGLFGCENGHQVWARYTQLARSLAKETSDDPKGMQYTRPPL